MSQPNQPAIRPTIALLTDFGLSDGYVGVMKGVIAAHCPDALCIDLTHAIRPQAVAQAAYVLHSAYRYFPPHTVFLCVVDPGVGTARRPVAVQAIHGQYVGPDNGLFGLVLNELTDCKAVQLYEPISASATFHGRDIFAPAAALLAGGSPLEKLGTPLPAGDLAHLPPLRIERVGWSSLRGEIIHVDHFGNLITSLGPFDWSGHDLTLSRDNYNVTFDMSHASVVLPGKGIRIRTIQRTYADTAEGQLIALISSDGQLEIAINRGSAAQLTGATVGDTLELRLSENE